MQKVLVADDLATIRLVLKTHLGELVPQIQIHEAADAEEAVALFTRESFDVIFLDGVFTDGTPVTEILDQMLAARPGARIVVTSARSRAHPLVHAALDHGAYDHLTKPVKRDEVRSLLERLHQDGLGAGA